MTRPVKDILWGYKDPVYTKLKAFVDTFHINMSIPEKIGILSMVSQFYNRPTEIDTLMLYHARH